MKTRKGLSPILAMLILITIAVTTVVITFAWIMTTLGVTKVRINTRIYSTSHNIGVLNENATFDIVIENRLNTTERINLVINAAEHVLLNQTVIIEPISSRNLTITQQLVSLGEWRINVVDEDGKSIGSYSFLVVLNEGEANIKINQWDDIQFSKNLSIISLILASTSLVIQIFSIRSTRRSKREKKKDKTALLFSISKQIF